LASAGKVSHESTKLSHGEYHSSAAMLRDKPWLVGVYCTF
jgi:carbohydrate-binding DOMON domain-containing protein